MADILTTITEGLTQTVAGSLKRITVETEWLPPIDIDDPLAPTPPGQESAALKILKPRITLYLANGSPVVIAPYGTPTQNWPLLRNLAIGLVGIYAVGKVLGGARRRRVAPTTVAGFGPPILHPVRRRRARKVK